MEMVDIITYEIAKAVWRLRKILLPVNDNK
jgi:hypothetical protein